MIAAGQLMKAPDEALLAKALDIYDRGYTQRAEPILRGLAQHYPKKFEVVETLGSIYAERGDFNRALPLLETACGVNGSSPEAEANLGAAYLASNRIQEAIAALRVAVSLDPKNGQTQSTYGQALMLGKRPREAARAFEAAGASSPSNPDILYNWALATFSSGDSQRAHSILSRIPAESRSPEAESLCGDVEEKLGRFEAALACLQTAANSEPTETNLNALGLELLRHWSFDAAAKVYEYSLSRYPSSDRLQYGLGIARYANNQFEASAVVFSRLLVSNADDARYAKFLGWSCVAIKGETRDGCEKLLTYARRHPENAASGTAAAATILEEHNSNQFELARQLLEQAISKDPRSADAYYHLGVLDQEQGKWHESLTDLKRSVELRPNSSTVHLRLALAYSHLDRKEEAHREAALQKRFRSNEDADMEARRGEIKTFVLDMQ